MADFNRRKNTRVPFKATVDLVFPGRDYASRETTDLSLQGVYVPGVHGHKLGEECDVTLHLTGMSSDILLKMKGRVTREEKGGTGLQFFETDLDSFYHLRNIMYYNSGDPDKLEEEFLAHVREAAGA